MWELIERNKQRSLWLFVALFCVLLVLGGLIGETIVPSETPFMGVGFLGGILTAIIVSSILGAIAYWTGDDIVMSVSRAVLVTKEHHPQLYNVVEEMQIAAGLERMPEIYLIADDAMNAFATGIRPEKSAIAVTAGLVERLNRDELQGVVAHEMAHIVNRDVLFMSFAGVLLGCISMAGEGFLRGFFYGRGSRRSRIGGGRTHPIVLLAALVFAILAPLLARIFYFAISRKREYLADATAVRLTRYPEGLASALEKISGDPIDLEGYNRFTAPLFIVNPLEGTTTNRRNLFSLGATHPPTSDRIRILRALSGASFRDYQSAYMKVTRAADLFPERMLRDKSIVPLRQMNESEKVAESSRKTVKERHRTVGDALLAANGFTFLPCICGLTVKVPPALGKANIACPRCGRLLFLPNAEVRPLERGYETQSPAVDASLAYTRKGGNQWESFSCSCGHPIHLSPLCRASFIECRNCGRRIEIRSPDTTR